MAHDDPFLPEFDETHRPSPALSVGVLVSLAAALAVIAVVVFVPADSGPGSSQDSFHPDGWEGASAQIPSDLFDPVAAGESLPDGYRPVIPRDGIFPVYAPKFRTVENTDWPSDELIIGVEIDGDARAYPIGFLTRREIVVDMHRGIPTFVTW